MTQCSTTYFFKATQNRQNFRLEETYPYILFNISIYNILVQSLIARSCPVTLSSQNSRTGARKHCFLTTLWKPDLMPTNSKTKGKHNFFCYFVQNVIGFNSVKPALTYFTLLLFSSFFLLPISFFHSPKQLFLYILWRTALNMRCTFVVFWLDMILGLFF